MKAMMQLVAVDSNADARTFYGELDFYIPDEFRVQSTTSREEFDLKHAETYFYFCSKSNHYQTIMIHSDTFPIEKSDTNNDILKYISPKEIEGYSILFKEDNEIYFIDNMTMSYMFYRMAKFAIHDTPYVLILNVTVNPSITLNNGVQQMPEDEINKIIESVKLRLFQPAVKLVKNTDLNNEEDK